MSRRGPDPRRNTSVTEKVEQGLSMVRISGVGPALDLMLSSGVPREVALRVLASPGHYRRRERRTRSQ